VERQGGGLGGGCWSGEWKAKPGRADSGVEVSISCLRMGHRCDDEQSYDFTSLTQDPGSPWGITGQHPSSWAGAAARGLAPWGGTEYSGTSSGDLSGEETSHVAVCRMLFTQFSQSGPGTKGWSVSELVGIGRPALNSPAPTPTPTPQ